VCALVCTECEIGEPTIGEIELIRNQILREVGNSESQLIILLGMVIEFDEERHVVPCLAIEMGRQHSIRATFKSTSKAAFHMEHALDIALKTPLLGR